MQWLKNLFGKKKANRAPQTNRRPLPSDPDFDIHAWLAESRQIREKYPEKIDGFFPTGPALDLGFSDCVNPAEKAEQERRLAEWKRQQEETKRSPATAQHRTS